MSDTAAKARQRAHEEWQRNDMLRALTEERQGYVNRAAGAASEGNAREYARMVGRIAQVDEQITVRGGTVPDVPVPAAPVAADTDGTSYPPSRRGRA